MDHLNPVLSGATAFASFLASVHFLKFWRKSGDALFLFFAHGASAALTLPRVIGDHMVLQSGLPAPSGVGPSRARP